MQSSAFFDLPARSGSGQPDVIRYRMSVEISGRSHEVTFDDMTENEPLRSLVARTFEEHDA